MHYLVYIFPVLINMMNGGMFFITAYRFAESGASKLLITATMIAWAATYCSFSMLTGKIVTPKRAPFLIILGCFFLFIAAAGAVVLPHLLLQYVWMCMLGLGAALYCTAFQIFMKSLEKGASGGTVRSVAFYTGSWSLGIAIGPFLFGILPWRAAYCFNAVCSVLIALGVWAISKFSGIDSSEPQKIETPKQEPEYVGKPNLVVVGWLGGFCASMFVSVVRTLEPDLAVQFSIGRFHGAMILALVSFVQSIFGFALCRSKDWMYRKTPIVLFALSGVIGLVLMTCPYGIAARGTLPAMYAGAVFCGLYSTVGYFMFTFHSLIHPTKNGVYISVNETLVGVAGVVTPFLGGLIAAKVATETSFYSMALALVAFTIVQLIVLGFIPKKGDVAEAQQKATTSL